MDPSPSPGTEACCNQTHHIFTSRGGLHTKHSLTHPNCPAGSTEVDPHLVSRQLRPPALSCPASARGCEIGNRGRPHTPGRARPGPADSLASGLCCLPGALVWPGARIRPHDEQDNLGGNGNLSLLQIDSTSSRAGADFPKWTQAFALTQDACLPGLVVYLTRHCSQLSISAGKT